MATEIIPKPTAIAAKVLRVQTEAAAHIVIRNVAGKKLFDMHLSGASISVGVPPDAEIRIDPRGAAK